MKNLISKSFLLFLGVGFLIIPFVLPTQSFAGEQTVAAETRPLPNFPNDTPIGAFTDVLRKAGVISGDKPVPTDLAESSIGSLINTVLTYIGVATMILIIYAGGLWATAAGNETKIETAKKILTGSVIGLVIIFSSAILVNFVLSRLGTAIG